MSDFHPETWNPLWDVGSILSGLLSFMLESSSTSGSMETSNKKKRELAKNSMEENIRNEQFCRFFPHVVEQYVKSKRDGLVFLPTGSQELSSPESTSSASPQQQLRREIAEEEEAIQKSPSVSWRTVAIALVILAIAILVPFKT